MSKQRERGSQAPMQPAVLYVSVKNAPHVITNDDPSNGVAWAAGTTSINQIEDDKAMDGPNAGTTADPSTLYLDTVTFRPKLAPGQYEIEMHPTIHNAGADGLCQMAISDMTGVGRLVESDILDVPAGEVTQHFMRAYFHATVTEGVELKIACDNASMTLVNGTPLAIIRRIGNVNET